MSHTLRNLTIRLAAARPDLRAHLLPLLAGEKEAGTYQEYVDRKKRDKEKPLSEKEWEARTQGGKDDEGPDKSPKLESAHGKIKSLIDDVMAVDINDDVQNVMQDLKRGMPPYEKARDKMVSTLQSIREDAPSLYDGDEEDPEKDPVFKKKLKSIDDAIKLVKGLPTTKADYRNLDYEHIYRDN
jgi:hypothetical protein